jgi:1,4-dihydroxy-2-naphthoate octaprenyltransferase
MLLGGYVVQTRGTISWEPVIASLPIALLVALILYVNEIPDRRGDARVGKRTLPVRLSPSTVVAGYRGSVVAAYAIVVVGVVIGVLPIPALLALLTVPLARDVSRGLEPNYDNPYGLMAIMGVNVKVHLYAGLLLLAGYAVVLILGAVAPSVSLFVGR